MKVHYRIDDCAARNVEIGDVVFYNNNAYIVASRRGRGSCASCALWGDVCSLSMRLDCARVMVCPRRNKIRLIPAEQKLSPMTIAYIKSKCPARLEETFGYNLE